MDKTGSKLMVATGQEWDLLVKLQIKQEKNGLDWLSRAYITMLES